MLVLGLPPEQVPWGREIEERVTSAPAHSGTISVLPKRKRKLSSEQADRLSHSLLSAEKLTQAGQKVVASCRRLDTLHVSLF